MSQSAADWLSCNSHVVKLAHIQDMMMTLNATEKATQVSRMFARIVPTYDLINRLMSAGQDQSWRRLAVAYAAPSAHGIALDIATGTADLAMALAEKTQRVIGVDLCAPMFAPAKEKIRQAGVNGRITLCQADALSLPFADESFDCATVAFGVRNMADLVAAFREMRRVTRPGGRVVSLEIMRPGSGLVGKGYEFYLTKVIPLLGGLVSKDPEAYRYLSASVMGFRSPEELRDIMLVAGFSSVTYRTLSFATIALHVGVR